MLTNELKALFTKTAKMFKGGDRRLFIARVVKILGKGGQRRAERELKWNRGTIRKGTQELESGFTCEDAFSFRGRKPVEEHLPNLLDHCGWAKSDRPHLQNDTSIHPS